MELSRHKKACFLFTNNILRWDDMPNQPAGRRGGNDVAVTDRGGRQSTMSQLGTKRVSHWPNCRVSVWDVRLKIMHPSDVVVAIVRAVMVCTMVDS